MLIYNVFMEGLKVGGVLYQYKYIYMFFYLNETWFIALYLSWWDTWMGNVECFSTQDNGEKIKTVRVLFWRLLGRTRLRVNKVKNVTRTKDALLHRSETSNVPKWWGSSHVRTLHERLNMSDAETEDSIFPGTLGPTLSPICPPQIRLVLFCITCELERWVSDGGD